MAWGWGTDLLSSHEDQIRFQTSQTNKNVLKCIAGAGTPEDSPGLFHEAGTEDQAKIHGASECLGRFRVDPRGCLPAPSMEGPLSKEVLFLSGRTRAGCVILPEY